MAAKAPMAALMMISVWLGASECTGIRRLGADVDELALQEVPVCPAVMVFWSGSQIFFWLRRGFLYLGEAASNMK